ncbi:sensor histidine kinase [Microbacterium sp. CJ88]|uniref:sensor histidine kinase n=1 Tax=Microbacterium sp. CJ88 TaxID=3445672 RepID=UPI003F65C4A9
MTADSDRAVLDAAWGHISQTRDATVSLGSFTRQRIERTIALVAGIGSAALGAQAFFASLGSSEELPGWHFSLTLLAFGPLAAMVLAGLIGRGVRVAAGIFAVSFVVCLALWPVVTAGSVPEPGSQPWIYFLVNISTLAAVLAFGLPLQLVWTIGAPLLYGLVRLIQGGFVVDLQVPLILDVSFALLLGGVLLALGWVFRSVAANVDATRAQAVDSYAAAAAAAAAEQERFAVAAFMHDSVLAALISAERATSSRERMLAVAMAREALTRLANAEQDAGEGSDAPQPVGAVADDIEREARELGVAITVRRAFPDDAPAIPGRVARALALASTQAVANSIQHAGGMGLAVSVTASTVGGADAVPGEGGAGEASVRITVSDTGPGFDLQTVPEDRLGIRGSIVARLAAIGGTAVIDTGARGTAVTLEWKHSLR